MRILYFHQYFNTPSGTGGTRSYEMARALINAGHEVHMICCSTSKNNTGISAEFKRGFRSGAIDGILVSEFELNYSNYDGKLARTWKFLLYAIRSSKQVFELEHDLILATSTPLTAAIPGILAKRVKKSPFVFEVRDLWPEIPRAMGVINNRWILWLMDKLELLAYNASDACIGLSPGIVEGIQKKGSAHLRVEMIPNGCDLDLFAPSNISMATIDGIEPDDFVCVFTGAHGVANGLDAVLDAAAELIHRKIYKIKFLFIGDGAQKPRLMKRTVDEGLSNCVFHGSIAKTQLPAVMSRANLALMILENVPAFYYGTSPNKFFDYISMGMPVLTNYPGWIADLINEHQIGVAVEPESPGKFADALEYLCAHREKLPIFGANARRLAETQFDRRDLANQFTQMLESVASRK